MYDKCFQLRGDPFSETVDADLFHCGPGVDRAFVFLERALTGASEALLVIGEQGVGKSALLSRFAAKLGARSRSDPAGVGETGARAATASLEESGAGQADAAVMALDDVGAAAPVDEDEFALSAEESESDETGAAEVVGTSVRPLGALTPGDLDAIGRGRVQVILVQVGQERSPSSAEALAEAIAWELGRFRPSPGESTMERQADEGAREAGQPPGGGEFGAAIDRLLAFARQSADRLLLLIDDADRLADEALRALGRLLGEGEGRIGLVLTGAPQLSLRMAALREPYFSRAAKGVFRLFPLSRQESEEYVLRRLRACGSRRELFSRAALDLVHLHSAGLPARINLLCREALLYACAEGAPGVDADLVERVAADGLPGLPKTAPPLAATEAVEDFAFAADEPAEDFEFEEAGERFAPLAAGGTIEERLLIIEERLEAMQALLDRLAAGLEGGRTSIK